MIIVSMFECSIPEIDDFSIDEEKDTYRTHFDDSNNVCCIMIIAMSSKLQKTFENTWHMI